MMEPDSRLVRLCLQSATLNQQSVETWRRQRRTLERMPSHLASPLLHRLLHRRLLYPSLLEVFKYSVETIDLRGQISVDAEWMAYIGGFRYLNSLNLSDCHNLTSSAIWPISAMPNLKELDLSRCSKITDAGIRHLLLISTLEKLAISETSVTADGVALLSSLTNLSMLDLGGLHVTDLTLNSLLVLKKLRYLDLWGSEIYNEGAAVIKMFPELSFLNLAWTKVSKLPNLPSLKSLNMSNCTIDSIFEGEGDKSCLTELILGGAKFVDVSEALLYLDTSSLSFLDLSNVFLDSFSFLLSMNALEHLDLNGSSIGDDSVEMIACVGATLKYLNMSNTRLSSAGVAILAGHVPNLETILLSGTQVDDLAISYISMMPSLKVINLSNTNVRGRIQHIGAEPDWVPSLAALQNLSCLERLVVEETRLSDASLQPLSSFQRLSFLSLRSPLLTDMSLYHLSSIKTLINLSIRDALLTDGELDSFSPQMTLKELDLRGCWLLTEDVLLSFSQKHPQIEIKHELIKSIPCDLVGSKQKQKQGKMFKSPHRYEKVNFVDERLKYTREELLELQLASVSLVPPPSLDEELSGQQME